MTADALSSAEAASSPADALSSAEAASSPADALSSAEAASSPADALSSAEAPADPAEASPGTEQRPPRLVRAELRKIFTTSTWWVFGIFTLLATGLALLFNVVNANQDISNAEQARLHPPDFDSVVGERPTAGEQQRIMEEFYRATDIPSKVVEHAANIFTSGQFFGLMLVAIIGVLVVTNEFQHLTATSTFLATPQRTKVISAKFVAAVLLAVGYWLLSTVFAVGIGTLNFSVNGYGVPLQEPTVLRAVAMNLLAYSLWAMLGVGLGVLIRGQLGATITAAAMYLISVPAALLVFAALAQLIDHDAVWNFIVAVPGVASAVMVASEPPQYGPEQSDIQWWMGALVLIGYGAVAGLIGTLITRRRDIS